MIDQMDETIIEILSKQNKLNPNEIHKKLTLKLDPGISRAVVLSRLFELVEKGYLELTEFLDVESDATQFVFSIKNT